LSTTSKMLEPFATRWVGENYNAPWPIALHGLMVLFVLTLVPGGMAGEA